MADRYGREGHRGLTDRAADEVRSWLGDEDAERRRRLDERERERHERMYGYGGESREPRGEYGPSYDYGWASAPNRPDRPSPERGRAGERWSVDDGRIEYDRSGAVSRGWNEPRYGYQPSYGYGYGDRWTRERAWQSGGPRQVSESRGIYEDSRGRVQQFEHGNTFAGRGPRGYRRSDDRIREDVCDLLTDDWRIDASDVEVTVQNGEVTLSGTVHNRDEKRTTEDLVETISGVREVHNQLRTTGSLPAPVG